MNQTSNILKEVENYYTHKILEHGVSARGVDWNSETSQCLRFEQLLKILPADESFSLIDYGCGYGALLDFMKDKYKEFDYLGFDISNVMLTKANEKNPQSPKIKWRSSLDQNVCDYTIASGIFNVRLGQKESEWNEYIKDTLADMNKRSLKGFSFNMLTSYSDKEYIQDYLFYGDPAYFFNFCKKEFSRYITLLHDYPLYEFSVLVKKEL